MDTNTAWAQQHKLSPMLLQHGTEVAARYRLRGTPTAVLIDTAGRIAAPTANGLTQIRTLLAGPPTT